MCYGIYRKHNKNDRRNGGLFSGYGVGGRVDRSDYT